MQFVNEEQWRGEVERAKSVVDGLESKWGLLEKLLDVGGQSGKMKARSAADHLGGLESGWAGFLGVAGQLNDMVKRLKEDGDMLRREAAEQDETRRQEVGAEKADLQAKLAERISALDKEYEEKNCSLVAESNHKDEANQRDWEQKVNLLEEKEKKLDEQIKLLGDVRASLVEGKKGEIAALNSSKTSAEQRAEKAEDEVTVQKKKADQMDVDMKQLASSLNQYKNTVAGKEVQISSLRRDVVHEQKWAEKADDDLALARERIEALDADVKKWQKNAVLCFKNWKHFEEKQEETMRSLQEARCVESMLREEVRKEKENAVLADALVKARGVVLEGMELQKAKMKRRAIEVEQKNRQLEIDIGVTNNAVAAEKDKSKQVEKERTLAAVNVLRQFQDEERGIQEQKRHALDTIQAESQRMGKLTFDLSRIALHMRNTLAAREAAVQDDGGDDGEDERHDRDDRDNRDDGDDGDNDDDDDDDEDGDDVQIRVPVDDAGGVWETWGFEDEVADVEEPVDAGGRYVQAGDAQEHGAVEQEQAADEAAEATDEMQGVLGENGAGAEVQAPPSDPWEGKLAVLREVFDQVECPDSFDKVALANELVDLMPGYTAVQWRTEIQKASDFRLSRMNCLVGKLGRARTGYSLYKGAKRQDCKVHKNKGGFCGRLSMKEGGGYTLEETQVE